jgi:hypothetical protein
MLLTKTPQSPYNAALLHCVGINTTNQTAVPRTSMDHPPENANIRWQHCNLCHKQHFYVQKELQLNHTWVWIPICNIHTYSYSVFHYIKRYNLLDQRTDLGHARDRDFHYLQQDKDA